MLFTRRKEMGIMARKCIPKALKPRIRKLEIDECYYAETEKINELEIVAFRKSLVVDPTKYIDFDYGFIKHNKKKQSKLTGTRRKEIWKFTALHIISNVVGDTIQWGRSDFKDKDFERIINYVKNLEKENITKKTVYTVINKYKLKKKKSYINILELCKKALKSLNK